MIKPALLFVYGGFLAIGACAGPVGPPPPILAQSRAPQCFRANEVYAFSPGPDGLVQLQTAQGPFELRLGPGCPDFSWIMQIGVRPVESMWLCEGKADELVTAYQTPFSRCSVGDIHPLGPAALPA